MLFKTKTVMTNKKKTKFFFLLLKTTLKLRLLTNTM